MTVKTDAIRRDTKSGRLANVVQQCSPCERGRTGLWEFVEQQESVDKDVALGMELRGLLNSLHRRNLRQDLFKQAGFVEQEEGPPGMAFGKHFGQLVADTLARNLVNLRRKLLDCGECCGIDLVFEAGGKADGAQHAQLVLGKSRH